MIRCTFAKSKIMNAVIINLRFTSLQMVKREKKDLYRHQSIPSSGLMVQNSGWKDLNIDSTQNTLKDASSIIILKIKINGRSSYLSMVSATSAR